VKFNTSKTRLGFTLVEMMMSVGCGSLILAAVVISGVAMQRSFGAIESYSTSEGDELRILDYIAMDCRRATVVSVSGNVMTLTLPVYYNSASNYQAVTPTLTSGVISYGSGGVQVIYQKSGNTFTREVKITNSSGTTTSDNTTTIAKNVSSFTINDLSASSTNGTVSCNVMFFPNFLHNTGTGTWWSGGSAPTSATGADGDWYVIDTTGTATAVGDVYYRSSGAWAKIQNVKATQLYCNTFLRNAIARQ